MSESRSDTTRLLRRASKVLCFRHSSYRRSRQPRSSNCHFYRQSHESLYWILETFHQHQHISEFAKSELGCEYMLTGPIHAQFDTARAFPRPISTTITINFIRPAGVAQSIRPADIPTRTTHGVLAAGVARAIVGCSVRFSHIDSIRHVASRARQRPKCLEKEVEQECEP